MNEAERQAHEEACRREAADDAFREVHNDSVKDAYTDVEQPNDAQDGREGERLTQWWRLMAMRYDQWRDEFREVASVWRQWFAQHQSRVKDLMTGVDRSRERDQDQQVPEERDR